LRVRAGGGFRQPFRADPATAGPTFWSYDNDPETAPPAELRVEAALAVPELARLQKELGERRLAGGRYASTTLVGPYEAPANVWARFMGEWMPSSGHPHAQYGQRRAHRNTPADVPND
jgi:AraC family transcriptional regulator